MFIVAPQHKKRPPYAYWENAFSEDEIRILKSIALSADLPGCVGISEDDSETRHVRRSKVTWEYYSEENHWFFNRMAEICARLNADYFNFDILGMFEGIQFSNYDCGEEGHFDWHNDFSEKYARKLSIVVHLSDPGDYEGGDLQIMESPEPNPVFSEAGSLCVFPAWQMHRVTPVTKGNRQSMVAWVSGPQFR